MTTERYKAIKSSILKELQFYNQPVNQITIIETISMKEEVALFEVRLMIWELIADGILEFDDNMNLILHASKAYVDDALVS